MPELPEVETARRAVHAAAAGRRIARAFVAADRMVFPGVSPAALASALTGRVIAGTARRGKYLWLELDRRPWLLVHFGMTGWFEPAADGATPRFLKLDLLLDSGTRLVYTDPRRLGRIRLVHDPLAAPPVSRLGFDPWLDLPPPAAFHRALARRRKPLKALLLDQAFSAGVGNWIADEVLYQARLDPRRSAHTLAPEESRRVHRALRRIVALAVRVGSDDARFPKNWLFHYRWGRAQGARDHAGRPITFLTVGGRTTAWVQAVQGGSRHAARA